MSFHFFLLNASLFSTWQQEGLLKHYITAIQTFLWFWVELKGISSMICQSLSTVWAQRVLFCIVVYQHRVCFMASQFLVSSLVFYDLLFSPSSRTNVKHLSSKQALVQLCLHTLGEILNFHKTLLDCRLREFQFKNDM